MTGGGRGSLDRHTRTYLNIKKTKMWCCVEEGVKFSTETISLLGNSLLRKEVESFSHLLTSFRNQQHLPLLAVRSTTGLQDLHLRFVFQKLCPYCVQWEGLKTVKNENNVMLWR